MSQQGDKQSAFSLSSMVPQARDLQEEVRDRPFNDTIMSGINQFMEGLASPELGYNGQVLQFFRLLGLRPENLTGGMTKFANLMKAFNWSSLGAFSVGTRFLNWSGGEAITVTDTTTETSVLPAGEGVKVIPSVLLIEGSVVQIKGYATISDQGNPDFRVRFFMQNKVILDTGTVGLSSNTDELLCLDASVVIEEDSSVSEVMAHGCITISSDIVLPLINMSGNTLDTTIPVSFDMTVEWGTASANNSITWDITTVETGNVLEPGII